MKNNQILMLIILTLLKYRSYTSFLGMTWDSEGEFCPSFLTHHSISFFFTHINTINILVHYGSDRFFCYLPSEHSNLVRFHKDSDDKVFTAKEKPLTENRLHHRLPSAKCKMKKLKTQGGWKYPTFFGFLAATIILQLLGAKKYIDEYTKRLSILALTTGTSNSSSSDDASLSPPSPPCKGAHSVFFPSQLLPYNEYGICDNFLFDAVILSAGGVGSTSLFLDLATVGFERINDKGDRDLLKHSLYRTCMSRLTRLQKRGRSKANATLAMTNECSTRLFIYTFDQAAASVLSLYGRNYQKAHNKKLRYKPFSSKVFPKDVQTYARSNIDYLGLEAHFMSWFAGGLWESKVPIFFLRSSFRGKEETKAKVFSVIKSLLKNDVDMKPRIEPLQVERSKYLLDNSTSPTFKKLQITYHGFQSTLDNLGYLTMVYQGQVLRLV